MVHILRLWTLRFCFWIIYYHTALSHRSHYRNTRIPVQRNIGWKLNSNITFITQTRHSLCYMVAKIYLKHRGNNNQQNFILRFSFPILYYETSRACLTENKYMAQTRGCSTVRILAFNKHCHCQHIQNVFVYSSRFLLVLIPYTKT